MLVISCEIFEQSEVAQVYCMFSKEFLERLQILIVTCVASHTGRLSNDLLLFFHIEMKEKELKQEILVNMYLSKGNLKRGLDSRHLD